MKLKILSVLLLSFLAGCVRVGPDFSAPGTNPQEAWTEQTPPVIETNEEIELGAWWMHYNDETLNVLVDFALQKNYTIEAAVNRIIVVRANLGFAIGEYFPQTQQAEGSSFRTHISKNAPNTINAARDYRDSITGLRLAWELDFWGRYGRGVEAAYGEYAASQDDYRDVQRLLISDVVLAYVQHKTLQHRIATLDSNIAIQKRSADIAKVRWEKGIESELDYAQAVSLWKETQAQKTSLEIELKTFTTSLATLVGLTPEEFICIFPIDAKPIEAPTGVTMGYPAQILCQRPDLRRSLDLLYSQNANVGIAVSDLYPRISFTGFLGFECANGTKSTFNQKGKHLFSPNSLTFFLRTRFRLATVELLSP